ncbi:hypothetical protein 162281008 [Organic Lake phycodnavirus]|nr:hypothetical protein 162281008 [Organic Lake phycodnavirus]
MSCPEEIKSLHFQYKTAYEIAVELGVSQEVAVKGVLVYKEKKDLQTPPKKKKPEEEGVPSAPKKAPKKTSKKGANRRSGSCRRRRATQAQEDD